MMRLNLRPAAGAALNVLCLGAHSDDIEIGCGGTILELGERYPGATFHWVVFSASGVREAEAKKGAALFAGSYLRGPFLKTFRDGFIPYNGSEIKMAFEELKPVNPDVIFTHQRHDAHQDHRLLCELTWNTFRDHLILEYEIPKYDGDMGRPNVFMPLKSDTAQAKARNILDAFASQQGKQWFQESTFLSLMRLRGMESNSPSGYAEAFYCRKLVL
jgi:LmbE family N-acetylglucosaminyl deacetylase